VPRALQSALPVRASSLQNGFLDSSYGESDTAAQAVYTDVDGTVVAYNSTFEFLRFDAAEHLRAREGEEVFSGLPAAARDGMLRSGTNAR
jgi:hypothetical protein